MLKKYLFILTIRGGNNVQKNSDYLRDSLQIPKYDLAAFIIRLRASSSIRALEWFMINYKNVDWHFVDSFNSFPTKTVPIECGWAISLDTSKYTKYPAPNILVTGNIDFDFKPLSKFIDGLTRSKQLQGHLAAAWNDCVNREFSILNMSLTPIFDRTCRTKSSMIPVFLYNLNRYYEGKSNQLFKEYTAKEETNFKAYLDSAFEELTFGNKLEHVENYCSRVLFVEDPQLITALIDFGELSQTRLNHDEEILQSVDEFEKFIHLVLWYWAEKEVNIQLMTLGAS